MTEDNFPRVSPSESTVSSTTKQRRKRKWDQPAESLVAAGITLPGIVPLSNIGSLAGISLPGVAPMFGVSVMNPLTSSCETLPQAFQLPLVQQHAATLVQKINQPKIQDELIAREIVINDAESAVRYKLTKRQTQEEIQKCTGAVVITRGKYRPPNAPPDGEKPLYLHISAGAHLETTAERIKAVDRAASMVEEMLKLGSVNDEVKVTQLLSTCVFLGFDVDPSSNIAARIRGPNDQYVNHIVNETGAIVLLRGCGSGDAESVQGEEGQQPLHLFLSSNNPKSLERAKLLAENLLDTICSECGATRVSSSKVYGAVPPPQQILSGVQSSGNELNTIPAAGLASLAVGSVPIQAQPNTVRYPQSSLIGGTSYSGYGGIYPQATPLQQVALALRQSTSTVTSTVAPATTEAAAESHSRMSSSSEKEKRPPQKRKFQELPVSSKGPAKPHQNSLQGSQFLKPCKLTADLGVRNVSTMPVPKKLVQPSYDGMPPPPRRTMLPPPSRTMPPPPPKFNSSMPNPEVHEDSNTLSKLKAETIPDTLVKLVEYGDEDEDDDLEEITEEPFKSNSDALATRKPFWAV